MEIGEHMSDEENARERGSLSSSASAAPREFDMSQDSQAPRGGEEDDSSPNSSSSSGQPRPPRRTIVALHLSSQSSAEDYDDDDEGDNAFASLESFLQGKFEDDDDQTAAKPAAPKLDTDNQRVSTRLSNDDSPNKQNKQQLPQYNSSVQGMKSQLHAERQSPHKTLIPLPSAPAVSAAATTTTDKVDPILPDPADTLANDAYQNRENNDANDFALPDFPEQPPPSQTTTHKRRKRPLDNFARRGGNHGSQTLWPSFEAPASQGRNQLLDRNRRAAQNLQKQKSGAPTARSMPSSRKKSRVIPSPQSSLVGSLPQRWIVQSTSNSRGSQQQQQQQQQQAQSTSTKRRTASRLAPKTIIQSTPAWRTGARKPLQSQPTRQPQEQQDSSNATTGDETTTTPKKTTVYRPFGGTSLLSADRHVEEDAIADVPDATLTEESNNDSPENANKDHSLRWTKTTTTTAAFPSSSRPSPKPLKHARGPLLTAFLAAKDKWQSDRLRLSNNHQTGGTTSATSAASSFAFRSNPMDDPRRQAKSYTDVTILGPGKRTTSGAGYLVHAVYLHQHCVVDAGTPDASPLNVEQQQLAWACFPRGQAVGEALRIYNAVVVPWQQSTVSDGQQKPQPQWMILATQVYEACPRDVSLMPHARILENLAAAKQDSPKELDSCLTAEALGG